MYNDTRMDREDGLQEVPCSSSPLLRWTLAPLLGFIMTITILKPFFADPKKTSDLSILRLDGIFYFNSSIKFSQQLRSWVSNHWQVCLPPSAPCEDADEKVKKKNPVDFQTAWVDEIWFW